MTWRPAAMILVSFVAAGAAVWFAPDLLGLIGLSEFTVLGQVCAAVAALTVLEVAFKRVFPP